MKVNRVQIKNFRSISEADCSLSKVNFITGANNVGKSSFVNAIEYAMINKCTFANKLQEMRKKKDGNSFDGIAVAAEVTNFGNIMRYCKTGNQINRFNGEVITDTKIEDLFVKEFNFGYPTMEIMFDASRFTSMTPKEQKSFLLKLTGISLNANTIISYMDNPSEEAKVKVREVIQGNMSIDDFEKVYKQFYSDRTSEKRKLQDIQKRRSGFENVVSQKIETNETEEEIKLGLEKLRKEIDECTKIIAVAIEREKAKKELEEKINKGKTNIQLVKDKLDTNVGNSKEDVDRLEKEIVALDKDKTANDRELGACKEAIVRFKKLKEKLNTDKCPLSDRLICNANKQPLIDEFDTQISFYENKQKELLAKIEKETKEIVEKKEIQNKIRKNIEYMIWIENNTNILKAREEEIKNIEVPNVVEKKERKEFLQKEWNSRNEILNALLNAKKMDKLLKETKAEETKVVNNIVLYEYLVKEFEANGIRSRILKKIIEPLQVEAAKEMEMLESNASLKFSIDGEGFEVLIENETGVVPLEQLSASEKLRAQIVIQDIVNKLTGVGILVIDEASILDKDNFKKLIELLNTIEHSYGTIFVAITTNKKEIQENANLLLSCCNGDSSIFWVEDGTVSKI